eukprot:TRINITY_DN6913_c0_g1_i1.p1 TRINITY_DN6913_c0_g1~~TRINITY_DN6913_c0_g1_i1.p1  ORF type:complete len:101 (+),score=17.62 TRINITY_DN6913_c0_g1_i1:120-422(+)
MTVCFTDSFETTFHDYMDDYHAAEQARSPESQSLQLSDSPSRRVFRKLSEVASTIGDRLRVRSNFADQTELHDKQSPRHLEWKVMKWHCCITKHVANAND